jgi:hypothetical protein
MNVSTIEKRIKNSHKLTPSSKSVLPETSEKIRTSAWITHYHFIYFYLGMVISNIGVRSPDVKIGYAKGNYWKKLHLSLMRRRKIE